MGLNISGMDSNILEILENLHIDTDSISDPGTRSIVIVLMNLVEQLAQETQKLKEENQFLKDENNRLKGEQGCPKIRPQKKAEDISSEQERKIIQAPKVKKSRMKKAEMTRSR